MSNPLGTWANPLSEFIKSPAFRTIGMTLKRMIDEGQPVMPFHSHQIFEAFHLCPWDKVKVVILTNDPYLGYERDGLALSAPGAKWGPTPVLTKVFQAINEDMYNGLPVRHHNELGRWATQGILLLNCDITSIRGKRGAHLELWKPFIEQVIQALSQKVGVIFCLLGSEAQKYKDLIHEDQEVHCIEHPMRAVAENRDWNHDGIFDYLSRYCGFMFNKEINWN